jgi:environmental stress-induced protein Ves
MRLIFLLLVLTACSSPSTEVKLPDFREQYNTILQDTGTVFCVTLKPVKPFDFPSEVLIRVKLEKDSITEYSVQYLKSLNTDNEKQNPNSSDNSQKNVGVKK